MFAAVWEQLSAMMPVRTVSFLGDVFDRMTLAEEEIARAKKLFPARAEAINAFFPLCSSNYAVAGLPLTMYRAHIRELLERVGNGEDTRPGTKAEMCWVACGTSQTHPLNSVGARAYMWLFMQVAPTIDTFDPDSDVFNDIRQNMERSEDWCIEEAKVMLGRMQKELWLEERIPPK